MAELNSYKMAIDLLCCHLGLTEDEAKHQLGIDKVEPAKKPELEQAVQLAKLMQE
ncbi:hypothetical protein [Vibrio porteresiae]|uniref:Heat shock protein HtpX n=1 Tax=Vibrio porteresiae DSM 19223 TaxID=1123496 RepID=A0ABZ0Q869_9VIBR|nr:hypothetical protein [Vibrio porteresiae]WPC72201.1 hypothetical protein R8Z52_08600 [Vibrio porteresiae DSM 19223]